MLQWWNCKDLGQPENGGQDDHHKVDNIYTMSINCLGCCFTVMWAEMTKNAIVSGLCWHILGLEAMWKHWPFVRGHITLLLHQIMVPSSFLQLRQTSRPNHPKSSPVRPGVCRSCNSTCSILNLCAAYNGTNEWIKTITLSQSDQWATESLSGSWTQRMRAVRWTYITLTQGHRRFWPMPLWTAFWWVGISAAIAMPGPSVMTCA